MTQTAANRGHDGWVFLGDRYQAEVDQAIGRYPVAPQFVAETARTLSLMDRACRRRGADFLPIYVPSKASVYLDKVQVEDAEKRPTLSPIAQIMAAARDLGLDMLDLRAPLIAARRTAETYSRLNSHYTEFGGWVAWQAIAGRLRTATRPLRLVDDIAIRTIVEIDAYNEMRQLAGAEGVNNWTRPQFDYDFPDIFFVQPNGANSRQAGMRAVGLLELPVDVSNPAAMNDMPCLALGDSTIPALSPWFNLHFSQVCYRNHHVQSERCCELSDVVAATGAAVVFYVMTERYSILPLHEPDHWEALESFETVPAVAHHAWPFRVPALPLTCTNGPCLDRPNLIQLPGHDPDGRFAVRIAVTSEGEGSVMSAYVVAGEPRQKSHKVRAGLNHLYLLMPSRIDGRHLWLVRDIHRPPVILNRVDVHLIA